MQLRARRLHKIMQGVNWEKKSNIKTRSMFSGCLRHLSKQCHQQQLRHFFLSHAPFQKCHHLLTVRPCGIMKFLQFNVIHITYSINCVYAFLYFLF